MCFRFFRIVLLQFVLLILFVSLSRGLVLAQKETTVTAAASWTLPTLTGSEMVRLEGYMPTIVLDLELPAGWRSATSSALLLTYRRSDLVLPNATLTVRVNEQNLRSIALADNAGSLQVELPATALHPGQNQLEIAAFLPLAEDDECIIPNHPARWLELLPDSRITMQAEMADGSLNLAEFPMQFAALGDSNARPITFVTPDNPDDNELSAVAAVAFALARGEDAQGNGAQGIDGQVAWRTLSSSEFAPNQASGPVILIGAAGRIPTMDLLTPINSLQSGWLSLTTQAQTNGQPLLAVGGLTSAAVLTAANALLDPVTLMQMSSSAVVVDALPQRTPTVAPRQFTMADLGYGDRVVRGSGQKSLIYTVDTPLAWSLEGGSMRLHFAHSTTIDTEIAELTVYLNGHIISGVRLDAADNTPEVVEISLPQAQFRPGRNFLRLTFDFGSPVNLCGIGASDGGPWAAVYPDSSITLLGGEQGGGRLNLKDFPYFLASEADWENLMIVLPDQQTNTDLEMALNLVRALSIVDRARPFAPRWVHAGSMNPELDDAMRQSHLIILGEPQRQPLLQELNSSLSIPFDLETGVAIATYGISVPVNRPELGIVQLLRSTWNANRMILAVTGMGQEGYSWAMQLLTDPNLQPQLEGQVAVIAMQDQTQAPLIYTQAIADLNAVPVVGVTNSLLFELFGAYSRWSLLLLLVTVLLLIIFFVVVGTRLKLRPQAAKGH